MKTFEIGQRASVGRTFTREDLEAYAALTGDRPMLAGGRPAVPGPLLGGLFSHLLGTRLPGPGTNYLKQRLEFAAPAYLGEEITATVEVVRTRPDKALVNLRTICIGADGRLICRGEALVLARDVA